MVRGDTKSTWRQNLLNISGNYFPLHTPGNCMYLHLHSPGNYCPLNTSDNYCPWNQVIIALWILQVFIIQLWWIISNYCPLNQVIIALWIYQLIITKYSVNYCAYIGLLLSFESFSQLHVLPFQIILIVIVLWILQIVIALWIL